MPGRDDIQHSILIVTDAEAFADLVFRSLPSGTYVHTEVRKSIAAARRSVLERYYDIVIINAPLPDEPGILFALDVTEKSSSSVLVVTPRDNYEEVLEQLSDYGILVLPKPFPRGRMGQSIRFLAAFQKKVFRLERKIQESEAKMEEQRIVTKAKFLLVEKEHMTEDEAHRLIGKRAMDAGISRRRAAQLLMDDYE